MGFNPRGLSQHTHVLRCLMLQTGPVAGICRVCVRASSMCRVRVQMLSVCWVCADDRHGLGRLGCVHACAAETPVCTVHCACIVPALCMYCVCNVLALCMHCICTDPLSKGLSGPSCSRARLHSQAGVRGGLGCRPDSCTSCGCV